MSTANPITATRPPAPPPVRHVSRLIVLPVLVLAITAASIGCGSGEGSDGTASASTFPNPPLVDLRTGDDASLSRFQGTPVVVNLWATWCTPCRTEMPELEAAQQRYDDQVQIVGITDAYDQPASLAAANAAGVTYPLFADTSEHLQADLGVTGLPATAFLDQDGRLLELHAGVLDAASLDETIGRLYGIS